MALKIKLNASSYTLYCPEVKTYQGDINPMFVYQSAGEPGFANFPKPTCMFESVEKAQAKIDHFIDKAHTALLIAEDQQRDGVHRFPETADWNVTNAQEKLDLIHTFAIVKLDVTVIS
jgi:hypothetical protein